MRHQLALGAILATILGACAGGGGTASPSASASPAASPTATVAVKATCQPTSVKIAVPVTPPNVVHLPPYVAQELGYFKDENLTVELVRFEGGVGALRSMAAGGVNMAGTSTEPVISAIAQGVAVKIVNVDQVLTVKKTAPSIAVLANMWEVLTDYQYAVYAVPSAEAKSALTECMLRAIIRANRAMYDPALRARILDMAVRETKADRDVVEAAYKTLESGKAWPQNEGIPQKNVEGTVKSLLDLKQIDRPISFADAVDLTLSARIVLQLGRKDWPY